MRLHIYPSRLEAENHIPSLDCPCRPLADDEVAWHHRREILKVRFGQ